MFLAETVFFLWLGAELRLGFMRVCMCLDSLSNKSFSWPVGYANGYLSRCLLFAAVGRVKHCLHSDVAPQGSPCFVSFILCPLLCCAFMVIRPRFIRMLRRAFEITG